MLHARFVPEANAYETTWNAAHSATIAVSCAVHHCTLVVTTQHGVDVSDPHERIGKNKLLLRKNFTFEDLSTDKFPLK